jgi:hypothetical protein
MKRIHEIGGEQIKRIHTDSFAISCDCEGVVETNIMEFLGKHNYKTTVKGYGSSHFLNLNEGLIGGKLIGMKESVFEQLRANSVKIPKIEMTKEQKARWENYIFPPSEVELRDYSTTKKRDIQLTVFQQPL